MVATLQEMNDVVKSRTYCGPCENFELFQTCLPLVVVGYFDAKHLQMPLVKKKGLAETPRRVKTCYEAPVEGVPKY